LSKIIGFLRRVKHYLRLLPQPVYLGICYLILYFTSVRHLSDFLAFLKTPESIIGLMRRGCIIVFASHLLLMMTFLLVGRFRKETGSLSTRNSLTATLIVAVIIGTIYTGSILVQRDALIVVDDKARTKTATEAIPDFEAQVKNGVMVAWGRASERLGVVRDRLLNEQKKGHDLNNVFLDIQAESQSGPVPIGYSYLVVYVPAPDVQRQVSDSRFLTAPDFSQKGDVPKELVEHAKAGVHHCFGDEPTQWMTSTPFGHLAVASCQQDNLGTLIAATLWDERAFLESTKSLWETKNFGLSFIQKGEGITYTTEITEYGERRQTTPSEHLEIGRVTEVHSGDHVEYAYQSEAKDQILFPGLSFRIRFPENPKASPGQIIESLLVLVASLLLVGLLVSVEVIADDAEPAFTAH